MSALRNAGSTQKAAVKSTYHCYVHNKEGCLELSV